MRNQDKIQRDDRKREPEICAQISLKRIYLCILRAQEILLDDLPNKREALQWLVSIEQDIRLMNDEDNRIERDLFK